MENIAKLLPFASFAQMLERLPDNEACRIYLEKKRWENIPTCPHCKVSDENAYKLSLKGAFTGKYKCRNKECQKHFTVTVKTMFEGSHIELRKWFIAIWLFSSHKKGVSSHQLAKDLGITQKSAWFMLGRIRYAFKPKASREKLGVVVQCDETYIGGKNKNKHKHKQSKHAQGRSSDKEAVFGILQPGGEVRTFHIQNAGPKTLQPIIEANVEPAAFLMSDEWAGYMDVSSKFCHVTVNHSAKVYVDGMVHTNGVENFWSHLKRGITGTYHQVSPKHLHRYCDEFSFRYNTRKSNEVERFDLSLKNTENFRLKYRDLIAA